VGRFPCLAAQIAAITRPSVPPPGPGPAGGT